LQVSHRCFNPLFKFILLIHKLKWFRTWTEMGKLKLCDLKVLDILIHQLDIMFNLPLLHLR